MKTINDILKTLSNDELAEHIELIDECIKREYDMRKYSWRTKQNLQKLTENIIKIVESIKKANGESQKINLLLQKTDGRLH
jgi:hypothetical protein